MGTHPIFESDFDCLTENKMDFLKGMYRPRVKPAVNHSTLLESEASDSDDQKQGQKEDESEEEQNNLSNIERSDVKINSKMSDAFSLNADQYADMTLYEKLDYISTLDGKLPVEYTAFFDFDASTVSLSDFDAIEREMEQADEKLRDYYQAKLTLVLSHAAKNDPFFQKKTKKKKLDQSQKKKKKKKKK